MTLRRLFVISIFATVLILAGSLRFAAAQNVTTSPIVPSPRVTPRSSSPSTYVSAMLSPSIFSSAT